MNPGDVILIRLSQIGARQPKLRPALVLCVLPGPYQNVFICGISTQLHQIEPNWDELIQPSDSDFAKSGLRRASAARLSYLYAAGQSEIVGRIGQIDSSRLGRLCERLARHLHQ
jgi:mRNA interferase MazF